MQWGAGSANGGIPFVSGLVVSWDITVSGIGVVDLMYMPCHDEADPCASGLGIELIQ